MAENPDKIITPYIPWETFVGFISHLKATAVPSRIDKSVMPSDLPTLVRGQVQSALRFLGLIDAASTTQENLRKLVKAYDTPEWRDSVSEILVDRYDPVISGLELEHATQNQLDEKFEAAGVSGQMRLKSIRFYLAMLADTGYSFSPHLVTRRKSTSPRPAATRRKRQTIPVTEKKVNSVGDAAMCDSKDDTEQSGTVAYPMFFKGKASGKIVVPTNLSKEDQKVLQLTMAVVLAYAEQSETE